MKLILASIGLLVVVGAVTGDKLNINYAEKGVTFRVDVDMTDTVWSLKDRIHDLFVSAPIDDQHLIHANDFLSNLRTLASYGLSDGDTIQLEVLHNQHNKGQPRPVQTITALWAQSETYFVVEVNLTDTVRSVKERIHETWPSIAVEKMRLFYDANYLIDDKTLKSYGLKDKSDVILDVVRYIDPREGPLSSERLFVDWSEKGVYFPVDVEMSDTVWSVKDRIHDLLPSADVDNQILINSNDFLDNLRTLASYGLKDGDKVHLELLPRDSRQPQPRPVQKINIEWPQSETYFKLPVNLTDTVKSLKERIHEIWPSIPVDNARLIFNSDHLRDQKTLKSHGVKDKSTIQLDVVRYKDPREGPRATKKLFIEWEEEGVYFPVDVDMTDTIWAVKDRIHDLIPSADVDGQLLTHHNEFLDNLKTLDSYGVRDGDKVHLELLPSENRQPQARPVQTINIDWPQTQSYFKLPVKLTDKVDSVREKLHEIWPSIPVNRTHLTFNSDYLRDGKILKSYGVKDKSNIVMDVVQYKDPREGPKSPKKLMIEWIEKGVYFPVYVDMTDTVWSVKDQIHDLLPSADVDGQILIRNNEFLNNLQTLDSYNLQDGDRLQLEVIHDDQRLVQPRPEQKIILDWVHGNVQFILPVNMTDTVQSVKEKVHARWPSIPTNKQHLTFNSDYLRDERSLKSYGVKDGSSIVMDVVQYVDPREGPKASKSLLIKWTEKGIHFPVDVEWTDTVWSLKDTIHDILPSAIVDNQILIHNNDFLDNLRTISSYGLNQGDSVHLEVLPGHRSGQPKPIQRITVNWLHTGNYFIIPVDLTDTVQTVKERIHATWPSLEVAKTRLIFNNDYLVDNKPLKSYGVKDKSSIVLDVVGYKHPRQGSTPSSKMLLIRWSEKGLYFLVDVDMSDTVWSLKQAIHDRLPSAIPDNQILLHANDFLDNLRTLDSYNLQHGDSILLDVLQGNRTRAKPTPVERINVDWVQGESQFIVPVNKADTIKSVKEKIHESQPSIAVNDQVLMHGNDFLDDDKTIDSYGLRDGSSVVLEVARFNNQPEAPELSRKLTIKCVQRQINFRVNVMMTETVFELKQKINEKYPSIGLDRQNLVHGSTFLSDFKTLDSYNLRDGDIILLDVIDN